MSKSQKIQNFEQAMTRLEEIVALLEGGAGGLDESIAVFEEGVGLLKVCNDRLSEAEQKVRLLLEDENGEVVTEDFVGQQ